MRGAVVLDCAPALTMGGVLAGWGVKAAVARVVWGAASGDAGAAAWLAYSIP